MVGVPESEELRALREQLRRDEEALAAIEAALAQIPASVRAQVEVAAQRQEKYGLKEFVAYMRSWMTKRNLFHAVNLAYWLYGYYLSKYAEVYPDEPWYNQRGAGPSAGGPMRFYAPATPGASVVDAVFAKAQTQPGHESSRTRA